MPRLKCEKCGRPQNVCLCPHLVNVQAPCEVLILQHPSEQKQALATVPILQMCLQPVEVLVGEDFSSHSKVQACLLQRDACRVIFPSEDSDVWEQDTCLNNSDQIRYLIVLDGTWRKAKRLWHVNTWLHDLPCIRLESAQKTQYQIRSSSIKGSLSTLEAVVAACSVLDRKGHYEDLMKPFKAMIDMQIEQMGEEVFHSHYGKD